MKKNMISLSLFLITMCISTLNAQTIGLREISLNEQITNSTMIVEGEVIAKKSFWSNNLIYTANTVKVHKVFKGEPLKTVEVITVGGIVGYEAVMVSHGLKLQKGTIGLFMLEDSDVANMPVNKTANKQFKPYSDVQGFYQYNLYENLAANPFKLKRGITEGLYEEVKFITNLDFIEVTEFDVTNYNKQARLNKTTASVVISGFSPTVVSAGTKTQLTIAGSGFGVSGRVAFPNADNGGNTLIYALDSQIVSWNDTEIVVEVPSSASTGKIRVLDDIPLEYPSEDDLIVTFAESNVDYDLDDETSDGGVNGPLPIMAYPVQHYGQSEQTFGEFGYQWRMQTDFFNDTENPGAKAAFERAFETWRCNTEINWKINNVADPTDVTERDDKNIIRFDNGSELGSGTLGACVSYYNGCIDNGNVDWYVSELDIIFDDSRNWNYGPGATTGGAIDFETVAVHELGHGHQLGHVNDTNDLMHYALNPSEDIRVLGVRNIEGALDVQARNTSVSVCGLNLMTAYSGDCSSLSIDEVALNEAVQVYPNPSNGEIFITNDQNINLKSLTIFEMSGRKIADFDLSGNSNTKVVNFQNVSKGMYLISIYSDEGFVTKKLILE